MPNNNSNHKNDMDDFFAQFDSPSPGGGSGQGSSDYTGSSYASGTRAMRSSKTRNSSSHRRSSQKHREQSAAQNGAAAGGSAHAQKHHSSEADHRSVKEKISEAKKSRKLSVGVPGGKGPLKPANRTKTVIAVIILVVLAVVMAVGIYVGVILMSAPKIKTDDIYDRLNQRSVMYDSNGKEIENLYMSDGNRTVVKYKDIPEDMVNAVVSLEDQKFWKHHGFNFTRILGAIKDSLTGGGISGTSTVTQQLARNVFLPEEKSERTLSRKITEAYYTIILEKKLSKEQIMEAYLNTIYLGFNSYGIQAASQAYFSKDVKDLDTLECAALAALPQAPDSYALVYADYGNSGSSLPQLSTSGSATYFYNGDISKDRRELVLNNMESFGFITSEQHTEALNDDLKKHMKVGVSSDDSTSSYFTDYVISQLTDDLVSEYGMDQSEAEQRIYTKGLKIYTTMDSDIQDIVDDEFSKDSNFSGLAYLRTDADGNLLNTDGSTLLRSSSYYFDDKDRFTLKKGEYDFDSEGNMTIYKDKRLNIYKTEVNGADDVSIEFKGMYVRDDTGFYTIESGALSIPQNFKTIDSNGNAVISASFFKDENYKDFFKKSGSSYKVSSSNYSLKQKTKQPQAAMTIIENKTGELKAMIGGRGTTGKHLYNRATTPNQPGSSIKPIAVYGPALQMSYEYEKEGKTMSLNNSDGSNWGSYITAGSIINDAPMQFNGRTWPKNAYSGYRGQMKLRTAVEQSVNVCAVKVYQQIGPDWSASMLKKNGISTLVEDGDVNDLNPASLALGGLTYGATPLEMAAAYSTFPSGGTYKTPISYTKVVDANGDILLEKKPEETKAYNEGVAWIMTDILRTVVTNGIATSASIGVQPVGGKTGTTNDNFDIWFCGFTPQYSAALWMGTDVNIELSSGSGTTAAFWSSVMRRVCADLPYESFFEKPSNVVSVGGEYYTDGTYSRTYITKKSTKSEKKTSPSTEPSTTIPPTTEAPTAPSTEHTTESSPTDESTE